MRLFIAVELDEAVRNAAASLGAGLRERIQAGGRHLLPGGATWVKAANMHLTLRFLGEVNEQVAERVRELVARPFGMKPFDIELGGLGMFPITGRPRVLWIGLRAGFPQLEALASEVGSRLESLGIPPEGRPFQAHLTLARFREPAAEQVRREVAGEPVAAGRCAVEEVVLFESRLSPKGPEYHALVRAPLSGS
ncbi:MAG: RNA 2',3'-cyclic phosphodiesterase [Vicinamibacterales bacterium]